MSAEREIHIDTMQQAWDDYCQFCYSLGFEPQQPDFAFSKKTRDVIRQRDGGCRAEGKHEGRIHAAHYDHDKTNPDYDHFTNGRLLCEKHHLEDHIEHAGENGLTESQNNWAINMLRKGLGI